MASNVVLQGQQAKWAPYDAMAAQRAKISSARDQQLLKQQIDQQKTAANEANIKKLLGVTPATEVPGKVPIAPERERIDREQAAAQAVQERNVPFEAPAARSDLQKLIGKVPLVGPAISPPPPQQLAGPPEQVPEVTPIDQAKTFSPESLEQYNQQQGDEALRAGVESGKVKYGPKGYQMGGGVSGG